MRTDLPTLGKLFRDIRLLTEPRCQDQYGVLVGEPPEPLKHPVGDTITVFDGGPKLADFLGRGFDQERCRIHGPPVSVHVMGDMVGVESREVAPVLSVEPLEEIEVHQGLQADLFPLAMRPYTRPHQVRGNGGHRRGSKA